MPKTSTMQDDTVNLTPSVVFDMILRRRWFIIVPFCLAMLAGIYYALTTPKTYEASTLILIEPQRVPENYVQSIIDNDPSARIRTISEQVNSRTNIERIIQNFNLLSGPEHENMFLEDKLERVRNRVSVQVGRSGGQRGNEISSFSISFRDREPEKTMNVANTLATYLIDENLRIRETQAESTSQFLDEELSTMRERLVQVEGRLQDYRQQYMGELPEQLVTNLAILERLQEQLSDRQQSLRDERNQLAVVEQLIASPPLATQTEVQATTDLGETSDINVLKEQLAVLTAKYTERHPDIIRLKKMIADLENRTAAADASEAATSGTPTTEQATSATPSIRDENYRRREEIRLAIRAIEAEIRDLENQLEFYQARVEATPRREQELASLQRDYENIQLAYNSLLERKLEADIAMNMEKKQKGEQFKILDRASLPQRPVSPDMKKVFLIFLAAGLGLGCAIVSLLEYMDTSIRRPEEVESLDLELLATIPIVAGGKDRVLKRSNQILSTVSILISMALFVGFYLISFRGENAAYELIGRFIQF